MNILITGAAGMIGANCAEYFSRNNTVIALDNLSRSSLLNIKSASVEKNWAPLKRNKNIKCIKGDIRDEALLQKIFSHTKIHVVIHAAGQTGIFSSFKNPYQDFEINCIGTVNVLEQLRRANPEGIFLYCSTNHGTSM